MAAEEEAGPDRAVDLEAGGLLVEVPRKPVEVALGVLEEGRAELELRVEEEPHRMVDHCTGSAVAEVDC